MYFVPPTGGEHFYLRTLLTVVKGVKFLKYLCQSINSFKGAKYFEDLRQYNSDEPYPTFHAACLAQGFLEDDGEWTQCLTEASMMLMGA